MTLKPRPSKPRRPKTSGHERFQGTPLRLQSFSAFWKLEVLFSTVLLLPAILSDKS